MISKLRDAGIAIIRTSIVPPVGGLVATFLLSKGIQIEEKYVFTALTILFSGIYYVVLHLTETLSKSPTVRKWAGIFLGFPARPAYITSKDVKKILAELGSSMTIEQMEDLLRDIDRVDRAMDEEGNL